MDLWLQSMTMVAVEFILTACQKLHSICSQRISAMNLVKKEFCPLLFIQAGYRPIWEEREPPGHRAILSTNSWTFYPNSMKNIMADFIGAMVEKSSGDIMKHQLLSWI